MEDYPRPSEIQAARALLRQARKIREIAHQHGEQIFCLERIAAALEDDAEQILIGLGLYTFQPAEPAFPPGPSTNNHEENYVRRKSD